MTPFQISIFTKTRNIGYIEKVPDPYESLSYTRPNLHFHVEVD